MEDDVAPAPGRGEGGVAVAGGDVEDLLSGAKVEGFAKLLADDLQRGAHNRIVAGGPGALLTDLQCCEIWLGGRLACGSG